MAEEDQQAPGLSPTALAALFLSPQLLVEGEYGDKRAGQYMIQNEHGHDLGHIYLDYDPKGKRVYVPEMESYSKSPLGNNSAATKVNAGAHSLGTANVKSMVRALQNVFPDAEMVFGDRASGARYLGKTSGKDVKSPWGSAVLKPQLPAPLGLGTGGAPGSNPGWSAPGSRLTDLW